MAQPNESNWTFVGSSLDAEAYLIFIKKDQPIFSIP